jgi:hypothetical protein
MGSHSPSAAVQDESLPRDAACGGPDDSSIERVAAQPAVAISLTEGIEARSAAALPKEDVEDSENVRILPFLGSLMQNYISILFS